MRTDECLTIDEENTLREVYRRDVRFWGWHHWMSMYQKFGEGPMGLSWVLWPYKAEVGMPLPRRRMNEIYHECLVEYARNFYGLEIRIDAKSNKLILCDPPA